MPRRCTAERTASSGLVSRLRLPCIDLRFPGDEAQDPLPDPPATFRTIAAGLASVDAHPVLRHDGNCTAAGARTTNTGRLIGGWGDVPPAPTCESGSRE